MDDQVVMRKKSTSIHGINADYRIGGVKKVLYLVLNRLNNSFPFLWADKKVIYRDFKCEDLKEQWEKVPAESTPARKLCDLFRIKLPWQNIRTELGEIHVLDCGCGSGRYGERLLDYSPIPISTYTGFDVAKSDLAAYDKTLFDAMQSDMANASGHPTFYALVIYSYFNNKRW